MPVVFYGPEMWNATAWQKKDDAESKLLKSSGSYDLFDKKPNEEIRQEPNVIDVETDGESTFLESVNTSRNVAAQTYRQNKYRKPQETWGDHFMPVLNWE